ncbi:MAG: aminopyrimidine aminohydrolase [Bryobacteraceae bacterium]|nr:MAG: aminopyrimidine aminohydrolase [Bryobacteraceae bacterium]
MKRMAVLAMLACAAAQAQTGGFAAECWRQAEPVFRSALAHPFLQGLADGSLERRKFVFYMEQDLLYLREFSRLLLELAARAPQQHAQTLSRHALEAIAGEAALHGEILGLKGLSGAPFEMAPTNLAYVNHLRASVWRGSFLEGMAAVLPCYWYYLEAGKALAKKNPPVPEYQKWIRQYSGPDYEKSVKEALAIFDAAAAQAGPAERAHARTIFERSARYEWMFWDMAWRMERWPPQ